MDIIKNIAVPTGNILIVKGEKGELECLSLGDYGQAKNVKADFLGLTQIPQVKHGELLPPEEKWVITISSQYGCSCGCLFCDVPKVNFGGNATREDLLGQFFTAKSLHPEIKKGRINLHYARMGEPLFNFASVLSSAYFLDGFFYNSDFKFHPVISTMLPKSLDCKHMLNEWCFFKNKIRKGDAGLQLS